MRVALFGDQGSPHVHRWVGFLEEAGASVGVIGYGTRSLDAYSYRDLLARQTSRAGLLPRLSNMVKDLRLLLGCGFDAVNFHFLNRRHALLIVASRIPVILTCWGSDILVDLAAARGLKRRILLLALRKARAITCDAESVAEAIIAAEPGAAAKIAVITWGIDEGVFRPDVDRGRIRGFLGIPSGVRVLLCNRMSSPHYDIAGIIERYGKSLAPAGFWLIVRLHPGSDPSYTEKCRKAAEGLDKLRFLEGPLADEMLPLLYRDADVALHFPRSDATPVSMLEALAAGCGIVASDRIDAYRPLAKLYPIRLCALDQLEPSVIENAMRSVDEARIRIAETLHRVHSRAATVERLGDLLSRTVG